MEKTEKEMKRELKEKRKQEKLERKEKMKKNWSGFWGEFKKFISRGNVLDMAVAVIVGSGFSKIVSSLVSDIITPLITWLFGKQSLTEFVIVLRQATETEKALTLNYGVWLQNILDFLIIAFTLFIVLRVFLKAQAGFKKLSRRERKKLKEKGEEAPVVVETPKAPTTEELLTEIRDLLKNSNSEQKTEVSEPVK